MISKYTNRARLRCFRELLLDRPQLSASQTRSKITNSDGVSEIPLDKARPFESIPGPSALGFICNLLPGGRYYKTSTTDMVLKMQEQYGEFFGLPAMFGNPATYVSLNPADYPVIFRNEGIWPNRRNFESMVYYRQVYRRDFFEDVEGIIMTNGEKWAHMRSIINPVLMQPKNARLYLNTMLEVNDEFLLRIREIRNPETLEMPETFEDEINRLTFESVAAVALNTQLGLIRKNRDTAESKLVMESLKKIFDLAFELDLMPSIWRYVSTPAFRQMMEANDVLTNTCKKYIDQALARIEHDADGQLTSEVGKEKSVLEKLSRIDKKVAVVMALDMMMAGVDTTSTTLTGILLGIAKSPDKQLKLLEELKTILPQKDSRLTMENMLHLPYLRACIKEGIRMYPIGPGTVRRLPMDLVLSGYRVAKGSYVAIGSNQLVRNEKYVTNAKDFLPERWLRSDVEGQKIAGAITDPFLYLPFGFGPRSCAGKRIVDIELEITVARLVRNFNIEFNYPVENAFKAKFINVPAIPLKFKFEERPE